MMQNNKERNDKERNDDTQSWTSRKPRGRFIDEVKVSDVIRGDDDSTTTVLGKVLSKPRGNEATRKAEKDMAN